MVECQYIKADNDDGEERLIAIAAPASDIAVIRVLGAKEGDNDGRSGWKWFRLANGDLVLGVFPSGMTYEETELDPGRP